MAHIRLEVISLFPNGWPVIQAYSLSWLGSLGSRHWDRAVEDFCERKGEKIGL